jgi:carboxyl-terminal processing protease
MKRILIIVVIFAGIISSCNKDPIPVPGVTDAMARDSLYYIMKIWYYWYDLMPVVTKENYSDPYELLEAMRYHPTDRWSFVADYDEFIAEMLGTFVGHGIRVGLDNDNKARIAMIYKNSPLYASGVRRGWIIKDLNGKDLAAILLANDAAAYNDAFGPSTEGITNTFIFGRTGKADTTITSTKSTFTINSVILYDTLHLSTGVAGHIVFESFIKPSEQELLTAFAYFKAMNINNLILDLRYNSGGYLYIGQELASYIAGDDKAGTTFAALLYNNKNLIQNTTYPFIVTPSSLALPKIVVITTRLTASASEAVMNGLKPYVNIIAVGDTTNGKPTGMNGWACAKKYFFWPVTFQVVNALNEGDYFDGIPPDRIANDDITHDFNDRNEECLKEAISYLETGAFSAKGTSAFRRHVSFSEKPSWMNNTFILDK